MSILRVDNLTNEDGSTSPLFPNGITVNANDITNKNGDGPPIFSQGLFISGDSNRPTGNIATGAARFNTESLKLEIYDSAAGWRSFSSQATVTVESGLVGLFNLSSAFISGTSIISSFTDTTDYTGDFNTTPTLVNDSPAGARYNESWDTNKNSRCVGNQHLDFQNKGDSPDFTIVRWMKVSSATVGSEGYSDDYSAGSDANSTYRIENQNGINGGIEFGLHNGSDWDELQHSMPTDRWFCYTTSYNRSESRMRVYIDGSLEAEKSSTYVPNSSSSQRFTWGDRNLGNNDFFDMRLYSIRYYNRELTLSEIQSIFNQVD